MYKKVIFPFFLCLLLVTACENKPQLPRLPLDATILAFGDSLTYGNGVKAGLSYPAVLEQLSGRTVINAGVSGEETAAGLQRLPALLDEYQPQLLILCHGGNDILRQRDLDRMAANIYSMIHLASEKNIPVVLLGVPKPGLFLSSADVYRKIAESTDVLYIDDLIPDILSKQSLKSDAVHPNAAGYRAIAENINEKLADAGAFRAQHDNSL